LHYNISSTLISYLISLGYVQLKPLVVIPNIYERDVVCQGIVNSTVFNVKDRYLKNKISAMSSWFFRPIIPKYEYTENVNGENRKHVFNIYDTVSSVKGIPFIY
jgi:hypothetical protein